MDDCRARRVEGCSSPVGAWLSSVLLALTAGCGDGATGGSTGGESAGDGTSTGTSTGTSAGSEGSSGVQPTSSGSSSSGSSGSSSSGSESSSGDVESTGGPQLLGCAATDIEPLAALPGEFLLPPGGGYINVREAPFLAAGDGITDDTAAIQSALCGKTMGLPNGGGSVNRVVYFPTGTYLIKDTLNWCSGFKRYTQLQGQSRDGVVIRLADGAAGFDDATKPRALLSMVGDVEGQPVDGRAWSFRNAIYDLTIEVGADNPGAIGVSYLTSNQGSVRNVTLRAAEGSGAIGLDLRTPVQGPGLIRHVDIRGFDVGVDMTRVGSMVFEDLWLAGQRSVGMRSAGLRTAIHGLRSRNCGPALQDVEDSTHTVLVDALLEGNAPGVAAIDTRGFVYARDVKTVGYAAALRVRDELPLGQAPEIEEFASIPLRQAFASEVSFASLKLPIVDMPEVTYEPVEAWANARDFGAKSNVSAYNQPALAEDDATAAVQAALDSGASTVYLPNGVYTIRDTLHLRGALAHLHGMDSVIKIAPPLSTSGAPLFAFDAGAAGQVVLERIDTDFADDGQACVFLEHNAPRGLVLRNISNNRCLQAYQATPAAAGSELFVEDMAGTDWRLGAQQAWFRQLNPEGGKGFGPDTPIEQALRKISVTGGSAWIFGMKTEGTGIIAEALGGASLELLGDLTQATTFVPGTHPAIHNVDSTVSVIASENDDPYALYSTVVIEERAGVVKTLRNVDMPARYAGSQFLYASAGAPIPGWTPPPRDGFAEIELEQWDLRNDGGKWSVCRGGAPDLIAFGLPGPRGTLGCFYGGNWAAYERVTLDEPATGVVIRYSSRRDDKPVVELRLDDAKGPLLASFAAENTGIYEDPRVANRFFGITVDVTLPVALPAGTHTVVLVAVADPKTGGVAEIDRLRFW